MRPRALLTTKPTALLAGLAIAGLAVACGSSPPPPAPTPASDSTTKPSTSGDAGASSAPAAAGPDKAALDKLTAEEAKSGACDGDHKAALEKLLDEVEANVRAKNDEGGKPLKIESFTKRVQPLSEAAKGIQLTLSGKGTQVHVIAFSSKEVSLDVLAGTQAATTLRSSYQRDVTSGPAKIDLKKVGGAVPLESDSRQIEMKPGTPLEVRMRGQGCAGVVVFSKS